MNESRRITVHAFTISHDTLVSVLHSEVHVSVGFDPRTASLGQQSSFTKFVALWDTGATGTVINENVVRTLQLLPTGMTQSISVNETRLTETYLVNIGLPNGVAFSNVKVIRGNPLGCDVLIGMNIICRGDFAVSNLHGKTVFTFRIPSVERTDYVQTIKNQSHFSGGSQHPGRNDPCPCGSGKKYKKCHGASDGVISP